VGAARYLELHVDRVDEYVSSGRLRSGRRGRQHQFDRSDLYDFLVEECRDLVELVRERGPLTSVAAARALGGTSQVKRTTRLVRLAEREGWILMRRGQLELTAEAPVRPDAYDPLIGVRACAELLGYRSPEAVFVRFECGDLPGSYIGDALR